MSESDDFNDVVNCSLQSGNYAVWIIHHCTATAFRGVLIIESVIGCSAFFLCVSIGSAMGFNIGK